ncbi:hypothetical protein CAL29_17340 [Bordetella genomosp. 10]|uniref:Uncharacterized protein n=1 Tax=Bordetella genomosp. 10 TaxID=1416804 RepID=A0A261RY64_9BORD|nr:hypothetical protein CAL29_17340 [Bordetella genomosp. 10]
MPLSWSSPVSSSSPAPQAAGIEIFGAAPAAVAAERERALAYLKALGLDDVVEIQDARTNDESLVRLRLRPDVAAAWTPGFDTTGLRPILDRRHPADPGRNLEREIVVAMLAAPVAFRYPSHDELAAAVRIKRNIVQAAFKTELAFDTEQAERPADYWTYAEETGFTVLPGKPLIEALRKASQPEDSGKLYSFSCYRATEYVTLLGIAQELADGNPALLAQLQKRWETRAIMSGLFHDVFLREYGSMENPLPPKYYVPGDRLWFRNPDERSADAEGFEGSWVFYLGGGLFNNFWKHEQPFTLTTKCVEIYHWRDGVYVDDAGKTRLDESIVEDKVRASLADPAEVERILTLMVRLREPRGVYVDGGCIDTTRECVRWVCPGTADLVIPAA